MQCIHVCWHLCRLVVLVHHVLQLMILCQVVWVGRQCSFLMLIEALGTEHSCYLVQQWTVGGEGHIVMGEQRAIQ